MTKNIGNQGIRGLKSAGAWRGTYHPSYRPTKKVTRTDLARRKWLHKAKILKLCCTFYLFPWSVKMIKFVKEEEKNEKARNEVCIVLYLNPLFLTKGCGMIKGA